MEEQKPHIEPEVSEEAIEWEEAETTTRGDLIKNNKVVTATGLTRIQYKCKTCNKFHSKTDK